MEYLTHEEEMEDYMYIPSVVRGEERNTPSVESNSPQPARLVEDLDEYHSSSEYPEKQKHRDELFGGIFKFDNVLGNYLQVIKEQEALHSELGKLETQHQGLREQFEASVHHIPGLWRFSLPTRVREKYECGSMRPGDPEDRCECDYCFNCLISSHADAVKVKDIIRHQIFLLKKEHRQLIREFEAFQNHLGS
ncbi:hypothetical protein EAF04_003211 [Stromatinia cepivora]|nr:hypothetical protein EAF04_003211 [Stromatinia cepivora]